MRPQTSRLFRRFSTRWVFVYAIAIAYPLSANAQVTVDRVFPPVVSQGEETTVNAEGKFAKWPTQIDCDRSDISVVAGTESGKLLVNAKGAPVGVAWIRLFDSKSVSKLHPIIVSPVPVTEESEPNNKRAEANQLRLPAVVAGRLSKSGDTDAFKVSVKAGQQLVVSVTANQVLKSPMDAVLQLTDLKGNVISQSDDARGLDPQLVYTSRSDDQLLIRVFAFPETPNSTVGFGGAAAFVYVMNVTTAAYVDHVADSGDGIQPFGYNLEPRSLLVRQPGTEISPASASVENAIGWSWVPSDGVQGNRYMHGIESAVELPAIVSGHLGQPGESHRVAFVADKNKKYRAEIRSKRDGFLVDSKLDIVDQPTGAVLASNDDASRGQYDAGVDVVAKKEGVLEVHLSDLLDGFGPRHFYQLIIRESKPSVTLSIASESFVMADRKPLEIPVSVKRDYGFKNAVRVEVTELPVGVTAEPVTSEEKGGSAKSVKLKLIVDDTAKFGGMIEIQGTVLDQDGQPSGAPIKAAFKLRPSILLTKLWLTIPERETGGMPSSSKKKE